MRRTIAAAVIAACSLVLLSVTPAGATEIAPPAHTASAGYATDHVLVELAPGASSKALGMDSKPLTGRWLKVPVPPGETPDSVLTGLAGKPGVEEAQLDHIYQIDPVESQTLVGAALSVNDPYFSYQWHFPLIQVPDAWSETSGSGVTVAVIDTGISQGGEDLNCHALVSPYNAITGMPGPVAAEDDNGHGTHVAGTVAQCTNNGVGVAGVAFDADLMPVKVLDAHGSGTDSTVAAGIDWARSHGADVINLSLGFDCDGCSIPIVDDAIAAAAANDIVIVAAAGNTGQNHVSYPASNSNVIAVGAVDYNLVLTDYSSHGRSLDVVAPGGDLRQDFNKDGYGDGVLQETFTETRGWGYYFFEGTSMASPHVAGAAALLRSRDPGASRAEIRGALEATARDLGVNGCDSIYGHGSIRVLDALTYLTGPDDIPPSWREGASLTSTNVTGTEVSLAWPQACGDLTLNGYRLYSDGNLLQTVGADTTSATISGLAPATSYTFAVRAVDAAGNQSPKLTLRVKTPDTVAPTWPNGALLAVTRYAETSLVAGWSAASDNVAVTGYRLRLAGSTERTATGSETTVTGLQPGTEYAFDVEARDAAGNWSQPLTATVRTARHFVDTADTVFYDEVLWLSGSDITRGCNPPTDDRFCPEDPVTRGQMAAFLNRALHLNPSTNNQFTDDDTSVFQTDIQALAAAGITKGCNPPDNTNFCPQDLVTRGQMAAFLERALGR